MNNTADVAGSEEFSGQKVRLYPVTRIQGRADIELSFTPDQEVRAVRFRALEKRGMEGLVTRLPVMRAPAVMSRVCGTCGPFHQLASCMAIEDALGVEVSAEAVWFRELTSWLNLTVSHLTTIMYHALPDFALPTSDAAVKNIAGIYMVDQEYVSRLSHALTSISEALFALVGNSLRPAVAVPGGVSTIPDEAALQSASELLKACDDDLRETMRLAEMLTRRESKMMEAESRLPGYYMCSAAGGRAALLGDEVAAGAFSGGNAITLDPEAFLAAIEERPVPWSYLVPLAVRGLEPAMVGPLARLNVGFGEDTPVADLECRRAVEQWGHPLSSEFFYMLALSLESIWAWEKARGLLSLGPPSGGEPCETVQPGAGQGVAILDSPRGILAHAVSIDEKGLVDSYHVMSPLQFNYLMINEHLTSLAERTVHGIDISDAEASRLQMAVRSFNPCVPCGTH